MTGTIHYPDTDVTTMKLHHAILLVFSSLLLSTAAASEVSWMFRPGYYTHSPTTGKRVAQYRAGYAGLCLGRSDLPGKRLPARAHPGGQRHSEYRADLGRRHCDPALRRVGISLSCRGDAFWTLGQSARPLDSAFRFLAESLWPEPLVLRSSQPGSGGGGPDAQARGGPGANAFARSGTPGGASVPPSPSPPARKGKRCRQHQLAKSGLDNAAATCRNTAALGSARSGMRFVWMLALVVLLRPRGNCPLAISLRLRRSCWKLSHPKISCCI